MKKCLDAMAKADLAVQKITTEMVKAEGRAYDARIMAELKKVEKSK